MALPPGITPKTVNIGIASFFDGTLAEGTATVTAPVNVVHTPTNRPLFSSQISKRFVDGEATFDLCPTDAVGLNRVDWTFKMNVVISGALVQPEPIYFLLPEAGPNVVDLDGLVTVPSSAGTPISVDVLTAAEVDPLVATYVGDGTSQTSVALRAAFDAWLAEGGGGSGSLMLYAGNLTAARPDVTGPVLWVWPEDPVNSDDTLDHWIQVSLDGTGSGATGYTDEQVRDVIGTTLVAGTGVTVTPNDAGDTVTIAATGGGGTGAADAVMAHYEPGRFIIFPSATGVAALTLATASRPVATWLPVWQDVTVDQIGIEITVVGGAGTTLALALYRKRDGEATLDLVTSTTAVDATTLGFKEWAIAQSLTAGRYLALVTEKANPGGTMPQVRALQGGTPYEALGRIQTAVTRGGVPHESLGSPQITGAWPATLPLTDQGAAVTYAPAIYLRTA